MENKAAPFQFNLFDFLGVDCNNSSIASTTGPGGSTASDSYPYDSHLTQSLQNLHSLSAVTASTEMTSHNPSRGATSTSTNVRPMTTSNTGHVTQQPGKYIYSFHQLLSVAHSPVACSFQYSLQTPVFLVAALSLCCGESVVQSVILALFSCVVLSFFQCLLFFIRLTS